MNVISPVVPILASTNIAANSETEWDSGTTYNQGDLVQVTTVTPHMVYNSLIGNNTNRAPASNLEPHTELASSITSITVGVGTKIFTIATGQFFEAGMEVKITKTTTPSTVNMTGEVTAYDSGTGLLTVSVYSVSGTGTHSIWTITSVDEIGYWEEVESTEQYKMLDSYVNTVSENLNNINIKMTVTEVDQIALFGLYGHTVELTMRDITDTTVLWSDSIDLIYGSYAANEVLDWWEYYFGRLSATEDLTAAIGGNAFEGVLELKIIADTGENAKCGGVVVGRAIGIGNAKYGLTSGIIDYSRKMTDSAGRTTITEGAFAKKLSAVTDVDNQNVDAVFKTLSSLRSVTTAFYLDSESEMTTIFGFISEYSIVLKGVNNTLCNIEIEGLI